MWKAQAQKTQHEYPEMRSLQLARQGHTTSATKRIAREEARAEASNRVGRARKRAKSIKQFEESKKDEAAAILASGILPAKTTLRPLPSGPFAQEYFCSRCGPDYAGQILGSAINEGTTLGPQLDQTWIDAHTEIT